MNWCSNSFYFFNFSQTSEISDLKHLAEEIVLNTVTESRIKEKKGEATKLSTFGTYKWLKFKFLLWKILIWKQPKIRQKYGDSYIFKLWLEFRDFSDIWNFLCKKQNDSKLGVIGSGLSLLSYIVRLICQFLFYRWILNLEKCHWRSRL